MTVTFSADLPGRYLYPGEIIVPREPTIVSTVLGSCVSVCLFDTVVCRGGINHYLLPLWNGEGLPTPKYGNIAIRQLVERMLALGAQPRTLQAKIFGGASMWAGADGLLAVGARNIELARDQLGLLNIPIVAADVGGSQSRKLYFHSSEGGVLLRRNRTETPDAE